MAVAKSQVVAETSRGEKKVRFHAKPQHDLEVKEVTKRNIARSAKVLKYLAEN
jgi:hypothetical protein